MRQREQLCGAVALALVAVAGEACAMNGIVRLTPSDGVAFLVKCFQVEAGTVVTGVRFRNVGSEEAFPEVVVVHAPTSSLESGALAGHASSVDQEGVSVAYASLGEGFLVETASEYCVGIRMPDRTGSSPAIGASPVTAPVGCYIAAGMDGAMNVALVDLDLELVTSGAMDKARSAAPGIAETFSLEVSPNPFNPTTTLEVAVPAPTTATLRVFDVAGRVVRELLNEHIGPGVQRRVWDGRDSVGSPVAAGIYVIQFVAGSTILREKIVLVK